MGFPSMLYPLPTTDKCIRYQLVTRICSTLETGSHFMTNIKTTNEMVFKVDGMQIQTHHGIQNISQHVGGHAHHLNTIDTWIVCIESDITWNSNLSRLNWEYKVTLL